MRMLTTEREVNTCGKFVVIPIYQGHGHELAATHCETGRWMGPEHQDRLFHDVIIWDDWQEWLLMKELDEDTLSPSTENTQPHHGRWFGYEVVDDFFDEPIEVS
ncbi:uncharacterized protein PG986_013821 [Apiospora aurea]|uniref:Uncharacterized protein n=1 Tax=Apiospora aurea TaxID=335848 RepID=A0ABR1PWZ4_9PEZI